MKNPYEVQCITMVKNDGGGWTILPNNIIDCHDYSELEIEEEMEQLELKGWALLSKVDYEPCFSSPPSRVLYFRRKVAE